jgi:polysaccharide pyruvyl transferase WcaK-like protein
MKVLVYGWYHQGNIGDDLFMEAFQHLFPNVDFFFSESITTEKIKDMDAVFFGGGSFLFDRPNIADEVLPLLLSRKIFYMGVGVEADIHPVHQKLMAQAKLIATRSSDQVERLKSINPNVRFLPDLVYSLQSKLDKDSKRGKSVLVMPNIAVVPCNSDPHWKHASWAYFKSEFGQFLDWLLEQGYSLHLFAMCRGLNLDDDWASAELINAMNKRNRNRLVVEKPSGIQQVSRLFSRYETIITQRFHGIVLSEMLRTPYMAIHHHDKLKLSQPHSGISASYYNSSKHSFINAFEQTINLNITNTLPIESTIFETFSKEVISLL